MTTDEAIKDLQDRVAVLEVKACKPNSPPTHNGSPLATSLGIQHCGRNLFTVSGKSGVWASKKDYGDTDSERIVAIQDENRGRPKGKTMYRQNALSEILEEKFRGNCEGKAKP